MFTSTLVSDCMIGIFALADFPFPLAAATSIICAFSVLFISSSSSLPCADPHFSMSPAIFFETLFIFTLEFLFFIPNPIDNITGFRIKAAAAAAAAVAAAVELTAD